MLKVLLHQVSEKCNLIKFIIFVHVAQKKNYMKTQQPKQNSQEVHFPFLCSSWQVLL